MNTITPLYLHKLPQLNEVFGFLNSGKHLNRLADHRLWAELERERDAYEMLFGALGYTLRLDDRGFAWFHFDEASSNVSKTTQNRFARRHRFVEPNVNTSFTQLQLFLKTMF